MTNECKREFRVYDNIFVVDYWGTGNGSQAFEADALILEVNEEEKSFLALLYGDTYQKYKFSDCGFIVFDYKLEAKQAADKLPKPNSFIYQVMGKRVYKKKVTDISGMRIDNFMNLVVCFNKNKKVLISEIGISLFFSEVEARKTLLNNI